MCDSLPNDLKELKPSNALILRKHYNNMSGQVTPWSIYMESETHYATVHQLRKITDSPFSHNAPC